jgi:hypothetical protein
MHEAHARMPGAACDVASHHAVSIDTGQVDPAAALDIDCSTCDC